MKYTNMLPFKVIEKETGRYWELSSLKDLLGHVEEFLDILNEEFELYNNRGQKVVFDEQAYQDLAAEYKAGV